MYVATTQRFSYRGQESQTRNLQLIFLTLVTVKQSQDHQTHNDSVDPKQVIIMESLKDLALMVSEKNPKLKFLSNEEICQLSPLNVREYQK